jgi:NAD(P)-dependent dehydrogenase (short-subunit alcohol dehydrogenase family)
MRILITGAGRAIGAATATELAGAGYEVVATAVRRAIEDPDTPLRVPVGDDAAMVLVALSSMDDATFEASMRAVLGATW